MKTASQIGEDFIISLMVNQISIDDAGKEIASLVSTYAKSLALNCNTTVGERKENVDNFVEKITLALIEGGGKALELLIEHGKIDEHIKRL